MNERLLKVIIFNAILLAITCIIMLVILTSDAHAVDFSQSDKQAHALLGCATAEMVRGIATDSGSDNAGWWGLGAGVMMGFMYEAQQSHGGDRQDAYATAIGSAACIGISEAARLMVSPNKVGISKAF